MGIHPRRLRAMTDEVDQLHHESMRTVGDQLEEVHLGGLAREHGPARRRFLQQMAAGGAVLTVGSQLVPFGRLLPAAWAQDGAEEPTDLEIAAFAASVELAAVSAYRAAVDSGQLSEPVTALARLFGSHHSAHAAALNDLLAEEIMEPNDTLLSLTRLVEGSGDEASVLDVVLGIEEAAAATYYAALGTLDQQTAAAVATILPVESQHAVVLATVLERPRSQSLPVLQDDDAAFEAADYPLTGESADDAEDPEPATSTTESPGGGASQEDDNTAGDPGSGDAPNADQGQGE